jgi:rare lipoprotein A
MRLTTFSAMLPAVFSFLTATPVLADVGENPWFQKTITEKSEGTRTRRVSRSNTVEREGQLRSSRHARRPAWAATSLAGSGQASGQTGMASYYWQSQRVAGGGRFNPGGMTAAHRSLPFGTRVRVTRVDTGNSVEVTINDRGPFVAGRIIDLSRAAASVLGMIGQGTARVKMSVVGR